MIWPLCVSGQQGSESSANDLAKLRSALSQALDRIESLESRLTAAAQAIDALKEERDAAQKTLEAAKLERESLERQVAITERAIAALQNAITIYERTIELQSRLNEKHLVRIDNLEVKLDRANSRVLKSGVIGFIAGVLTNVIKIF